MTVFLGVRQVAGMLFDRAEAVTRVGVFIRKLCVVDGYADEGIAWARVCGHGVVVVNTLFARTEGGDERDRAIVLGPFHVRWLASAARAPRIDAAAARQLLVLARRHPDEASAFHGGRPVDDLSIQELREWCAALARGAELNEL